MSLLYIILIIIDESIRNISQLRNTKEYLFHDRDIVHTSADKYFSAEQTKFEKVNEVESLKQQISFLKGIYRYSSYQKKFIQV